MKYLYMHLYFMLTTFCRMSVIGSYFHIYRLMDTFSSTCVLDTYEWPL